MDQRRKSQRYLVGGRRSCERYKLRERSASKFIFVVAPEMEEQRSEPSAVVFGSERLEQEPKPKKRKRTAMSKELGHKIIHKGKQMERVLEEWTEKELEESVKVKFVYKVERMQNGAMRLSNCEVFVEGCETYKSMRQYRM